MRRGTQPADWLRHLPSARCRGTTSGTYPDRVRTGETLFYLEMREPSDLPQRPQSASSLQLVERTDLETVRRVTLAIGAPYEWPSLGWPTSRWTDYLARDDLRHWTVELDGEQVGLVSLRFAPDEVEIDTFGLVPAHVGRGLGGEFLTLATALAWRECPQARRVWLHTSSHDHPHALVNYERHGFRLYRTVLPNQG